MYATMNVLWSGMECMYMYIGWFMVIPFDSRYKCLKFPWCHSGFSHVSVILCRGVTVSTEPVSQGGPWSRPNRRGVSPIEDPRNSMSQGMR